MDRRLCIQALTTASAVAWLPGAAFAEIPPLPPLPPVNLSSSGNAIPVLDGETVAPDPLYVQAVAIVIIHKKASISLVQRHLRLGYSRAAGLLASMEQAGLIGAHYINGYRQILAPASA